MLPYSTFRRHQAKETVPFEPSKDFLDFLSGTSSQQACLVSDALLSFSIMLTYHAKINQPTKDYDDNLSDSSQMSNDFHSQDPHVLPQGTDPAAMDINNTVCALIISTFYLLLNFNTLT